MKKLIKLSAISLLAILFFALFAKPVDAREANDVRDWYIKDFESSIVVNKDSSIDVTERITADCGNLSGKHGIFRVFPTIANTGSEEIKTPFELVSITDFSGKKYKYSESKDSKAHTVTYKIGHPDKTVKGVNNYEIRYKFKNVIRFGNPEFDEFYWNLNGNFWEIETDHFKAAITFPEEIGETNTEVDYYTGAFGSKDKSLANFRWDGNKLIVESAGTLKEREGITLSAAMPKNIFTPYRLTKEDERQYLSYSQHLAKYNPVVYQTINWLMLLVVPVLVFVLCFLVWKKYGDDPGSGRSIAPEFDIPEKLTPIEFGLIYTNGTFKNQYFTAAIINLAVKGVIRIEEVDKKWLLGKKDYKLILTNDTIAMSNSEKMILDDVFGRKKELLISTLRDRVTFITDLNKINRKINEELRSQGLLDPIGIILMVVFIIVGLLLFIVSLPLGVVIQPGFLGLIISAIIIVIFGIIMPRRTLKNLDLYYKMRGFKLYMETAEKYRQQFNEKENIFEKFLPYAILFGITKEWIKKMKVVYGDNFMAHYPVWYVGGNLDHFDIDSFASTITAVSSAVGTASGAGGSGGAGGGGGGGGGGGW